MPRQYIVLLDFVSYTFHMGDSHCTLLSHLYMVCMPSHFDPSKQHAEPFESHQNSLPTGISPVAKNINFGGNRGKFYCLYQCSDQNNEMFNFGSIHRRKKPYHEIFSIFPVTPGVKSTNTRCIASCSLKARGLRKFCNFCNHYL